MADGQDFVEREIALERAIAEFLQHDGRGPMRQHLLEQAGERLWFVVVQREAMGISRHDVLYDVLRIPAEVRRAMGPVPLRPPARRS